MASVKIKEDKIKVGNYQINYALSKIDGNQTEKTLIMLPGALGEIFVFKIYHNLI